MLLHSVRTWVLGGGYVRLGPAYGVGTGGCGWVRAVAPHTAVQSPVCRCP